MKFCTVGWALAAILACQSAVAQFPKEAPMPADSEIRKIIADRIDKYRQTVGIVVGIVDRSGSRVISHGHLDHEDPRALNGDTIFAIDSITKVFTALLLTDMVNRGELALSDPIAKHLPAEIKVPTRGGKQITLQDLATHTSGLPREPWNLRPQDVANPYQDYSMGQLYEFLSNYQLTRDIGSKYEYSNVGAGLLGHILARRAGMDYAALVQSRITRPLAMTSTTVSLTPEIKGRLAVGHIRAGLAPTAAWDYDVLSGAGALLSSVNDLLKFLAANLGFAETPLSSAMAAMLTVRAPTGEIGAEAALGWHIVTPNTCDRAAHCTSLGLEFVEHAGGSFGYRSYLGYDPKTRVGVVVFSNAGDTGVNAGIADIGRHLLNPRMPLLPAQALKPPKEHKQVTLDPKVLAGYAGSYRYEEDTVTVTNEGGRLFVQSQGDLKLEIYPEKNRDFFYKIMDAEITFNVDRAGRTTEFIFRGNGTAQHYKRIK